MHKLKMIATRLRGRKKIVIVLIFVAVCVIGGAAIGLYSHTHRYIHGKITFQEFAPTYWPSGPGITEKVITATYTPSHSPTHYTGLVLEMADGSVIYESEREREQTLMYDCPKYEAASNQTCIVRYTSKGEPYQLLTTTFDDGEISQTIEWSRRDTDILINLEKKTRDGYPVEEIEKIIKSFKPVEYRNLEIREVDHSSI